MVITQLRRHTAKIDVDYDGADLTLYDLVSKVCPRALYMRQDTEYIVTRRDAGPLSTLCVYLCIWCAIRVSHPMGLTALF